MIQSEKEGVNAQPVQAARHQRRLSVKKGGWKKGPLPSSQFETL
jgi:hypothetical protein